MGFPGYKVKTLIVEDNATFRVVFKDRLQNLFSSMDIQEAADAYEALQSVEAFRPEFIFIDIRLPGENGLQLTQKIKASYPNMKVIILTEFDIPEYREAAMRYGGDLFVAKDSLNWEQIETFIKSLGG